jgi:hypothetical protein
LNPKTEVDRGDLMQSAGREGHSSEITVSLDTLISSSCPIGSASCIISSPSTSDFGLKASYSSPNTARRSAATVLFKQL